MTTFALIPGAGSDSWYWSRVAPLLTDRGHEVVAPDLPTTVLAGTRDRLFPLDLVERLARERLGLDHVDTVESGHLAALVAPRAVVDRILR
jgi:pimeloyl-ACP methyl ester carboxylesterase